MYTKDVTQTKPNGGGKEEKSSSMSELIKNMADNTGCQGVPNIKRASGTFRKVSWLFIVCTGIGMMIWKIEEAVSKYYDYPVDTTITYNFAPMLSFPAVTICNLNPIKENALGYTDVGLQSLMTGGDRGTTAIYDKSSLGNGTAIRDWDTDDIDFEGEDEDFSALESLTDYMAQMSDSVKQLVGHNLSVALMDCTYGGSPCSTRNFTWFSNYLYGNCYTFNAERWDTASGQNVTKVGPLYGLTLDLFVEESEYCSMTQAAGFRVVIHNQTEMPFPEDKGFSVAPGQKTSVGLRRVEITRPEPNYGTCQKFTHSETMEVSGFMDQLPYLNYSTKACEKTCYQQSLIERCGCYDSKFPYNNTHDAYSHLDAALEYLSPCNTSSECRSEVSDDFAMSLLGCSEQCPPECFLVHYERSISTASYPSTNAKDDVLRQVQMINEDLFDWVIEENDLGVAGSTSTWEFLRNNVLKLEIYYEDLNYETIITKSSYGSMELFSDLGGQTGFWLGLSVIALFEVVELMFDIVVLIWHQITGKGKRKVNGQTDKGNPTYGGQDTKEPL